MHITLVGINHKTAPVAERERFAFAAEELPEALPRFGGAAVLLSTCNRTEVYLTAHHPITAGSVVSLLSEIKGVEDVAEEAFYTSTGTEAARHLCRVAAGVDSMVLGEAEILGQVRAAFEAAQAAHTANPVLEQLFTTAIRSGRRARSDTHIGRHAVSVSSTAVRLARDVLGDLSERTVLVVSAGEAGRLTARSLAKNGATRVLVTSRRAARAKELAMDLGGRAVPFARLGAAMAEADIVISSSAAPDYLIGPGHVEEALVERNGRPLLLIDIAVPRDIDPAVREMTNVHMYDIDDLQAHVERGRAARKQEVAKVEAIVDEGVHRFERWMRTRGVVPTVAALRERADAACEAEVTRALKRIGDLTPEQAKGVEAMAGALVKKLLHDPITRLKGDDGERYAAVVRELFELDHEVASNRSAPARKNSPANHTED